MDLTSVMAHQGGWDETFFVAIPLVLFAGLLLLAKRRAENMAERAETDPAEDA